MKKINAGTYKRVLLYLFLAAAALALLLPVILSSYLSTPSAAAQISRLLSNTMQQQVVINSITVSNGTLQLKGLSLATPEGFPPAKLLSVDSLIIKPAWFSLLTARRSFEKIAADGITIDLQRNNSGNWNFQQLQQRFSSSKPSSSELFIGKLTISKTTVKVNDQIISGLALNVSNLATKGSEQSGFGLEFDDPGRNHYTLSGKARLGKEPELDLTLSSTQIALKSLSRMLAPNSAYLPENGNASLKLTVELHKGLLQCKGKMSFNSVTTPAIGSGGGQDGQLLLALGYDLQKDQLLIENISMQLNNLLAVHASGSIKALKQAKEFAIDVRTDEIDLAKIAPLIPELKRRQITVNGRLEKSALHLSGNASGGVTAAKGNLTFGHGLLSQDRRTFFNDLSISASISSKGDELTVSGKAAQPQSQSETVLEYLQAPFNITLNRQLKTVKANSASLNARVRGTDFNGRLSYADGSGLIENATVKARDLSVALSRLSARIPLKQVSPTAVRYPLSADFSGCDIRRGDAMIKNASGKIRGAFAYNPQAKWLEGNATINVGKAAWKGSNTGAAELRAEFTAAGGKADFKASVLGGSVHGEALFNPFNPADKLAFIINAAGIQLAGAEKYAGQQRDMALAGGKLDASAKGSFSSSSGLFCHIEANGQNIAINGKAGKRMLSDGGIKINSDLSGKKLAINQAQFSAGEKLTASASGTINNFSLAERQGQIAFTIPKTALSDTVDAFLNILPRSLQEATVEGSIAGNGAINLQQGRMLVDGKVTLTNINIDAPTDKIKLSGINGSLPLSLDLAGKTAVKPPPASDFSRQNYAALLKQLQQPVEKSDTITISSIGFGGLIVNAVNIRLRAAGGITELASVDSSLFGGSLSGKGFIAMQKGILYRGDLLFNDLSLVEICKAFPAITGYLSGKADGIVSILGKGKQLSDITGFTEFWARETSTEKMLVSKEFLQKLSGKKLSGFFFSSDRPYDHAGIKAALESGFLTFDSLDISHTNMFGVRDLSVTIATSQNRIAIDHLLNSIKEATVRGKDAAGATGKTAPAEAAPAPATEFKWAD